MDRRVVAAMIDCTCKICNEKNCIHRDAGRRLPEAIGGLGLCPNLKGVEVK